MPSVIESPSGRLPEKAPRWDLTGTEASGGGKVFLWLSLVFREYLGIYRPKNRVRRTAVGPTSQGARPPRARPGGLWSPRQALLPSSPSLLGFFWSKKNHRESFIPFGLRLIFLICNTQKQGKNRNWHLALG